MTLIAPGTCRHCGCHAESCRLVDGDLCGWADRGCIVCSGPACLRAEAVRVSAAKSLAKEAEAAARRKHGELYRGMGYGAIVDDMRKRERASRRRKKRAA